MELDVIMSYVEPSELLYFGAYGTARTYRLGTLMAYVILLAIAKSETHLINNPPFPYAIFLSPPHSAETLRLVSSS